MLCQRTSSPKRQLQTATFREDSPSKNFRLFLYLSLSGTTSFLIQITVLPTALYLPMLQLPSCPGQESRSRKTDIHYTELYRYKVKRSFMWKILSAFYLINPNPCVLIPKCKNFKMYACKFIVLEKTALVKIFAHKKE